MAKETYVATIKHDNGIMNLKAFAFYHFLHPPPNSFPCGLPALRMRGGIRIFPVAVIRT